MEEKKTLQFSAVTDAASARLGALVSFLHDLADHTRRAFLEDRGSQIAAALTYHTVFSLLPTMALALVVLKTFVGPEEQTAFKDFIVTFVAEWLSLGQVGPSAATPGLPASEVSESLARASEYDRVLAQLDVNVKRLLDDLQAIDFRRIGAVGVLLFIYAATGLLTTIEQSFNQIFDAPGNRPWYVRVPLYYTTITLAPVVIVSGQVMQGRLLAGIEQLSWAHALTRPMTAVLPIVTTWLVFTVMYALIPNTRVKLRAVMIGAALSAAAWVAVIEVFAIYVGNYAAASLYGALALFPLALLFVWVAWVIVLFGLELTHMLHVRPWRIGERESEHSRLAAYDPRWLLLLAMTVLERFERGEISEVGDLATELQLPESQVASMLRALVQEGLLHRVEGPADGIGGYVLACSPANIELNRLLDAAEHHTLGGVGESSVSGARLIRRVQSARREALEGETLASAREARREAPVR
jgi:membrane protein